MDEQNKIQSKIQLLEPTLECAVDFFMRLEMAGKSIQTGHWYRSKLTKFQAMLGPDRRLDSITELDLRLWYSDLCDQDVLWENSEYRPAVSGHQSIFTIDGYIRCIRRFFSWLFQNGILPADIAANIKRPRLPMRGEQGIADNNVREILREAKDNPRDFALLRFLESTGCRRGGVANLLLSDLHMLDEDSKMRRRVTVREKGDKERVVFLTQGALTAMRTWLKIRPMAKDEHVFLGQGPSNPGAPLTESGISQVLRRYKTKLALKGRVNPHQWRHRWARKRLQSGMAITDVAQLMGHSSVAVTYTFYGQYGLRDLQNAFDRYMIDDET